MAAAPGTRTLVELADLAASTGRLLRSRGATVLGWYCAGWAVHQAGLFGSAVLGVRHGVLATLVFVLAVVAKLVALVLMVDAVRPAAIAAEPTLGVVTLAVGPFLAVYAVWGFLDDEVAALFRSNYTVQGLGGIDDWSISVGAERLPLYLGFAAGGWLLRAAVRLLQRRRPSDLLGVVAVLAEGVWALSVFVVLVIAVRTAKAWLVERVVWAELTTVGRALLDVLPDLTLPFGPTLRQLATTVVAEAPGVLATVVGLPLMWLALTAVVYGWRDVTAADVLAGTRGADRLERWTRYTRSPLGRAFLLATGDLRTKYLPVLAALRLVGRAGPRVVGGYLVLATAVSVLGGLLAIALTVVVGPQSTPVSLLLDPLEDLVGTALTTTLAVALYGAVFARAVRGPASASARRSPAAGPLTVPPLRSAPRS